MLKSWRHQRDIVMTEYREPEANAMGLGDFFRANLWRLAGDHY
jgi:hypothetical protein